MIIGKWNKSVILTYVGLFVSILGIFLCFQTEKKILWGMACLIIAGLCDLFDGAVARRCKRTEEEKMFGIQLDSLVDVIDFTALPIAIFLSMGLCAWYHLIVMTVFAICGIARLAYFNITVEDTSEAVDYYWGLPVTYVAMIFPLCYLLHYLLTPVVFQTGYTILILLVSLLYVLKIKIKKPRGIAYIVFPVLAVIMLVLFLGVL